MREFGNRDVDACAGRDHRSDRGEGDELTMDE